MMNAKFVDAKMVKKTKITKKDLTISILTMCRTKNPIIPLYKKQLHVLTIMKLF